jgi:hypothetical protein
MADEYSPTSVANQAIDAAGGDLVLGDIEDGTRQSQVILRAYVECLKQLLRAVHWDFARRDAPLQMVADASGQTADVGTLVPSGFLYSYSYPTNCAKVRFIPGNYIGQVSPVPVGNIVPPNDGSPLMAASTQPVPLGMPLVPTRFLITSDPNYIPEGASNDLPGISPIGQTLILSNVRGARCVYTFDAVYPNLWDSLFRQAMVAYLASQIAFPLNKDKKFARQIRADNITIAQGAVRQAMTTNGNESWASSDLSVDWMRFRNSGGWAGSWGNNFGAGPGYLFGGLDAISWGGGLGNSSAF